MKHHIKKHLAHLMCAIAFIAMSSAQANADLITDGLAALDNNEFEQASTHFKKAFEQLDTDKKSPKHYADAAFYMGRMHETGLGAPRDLDAAVAFYVLGSEKDSPLAQNRLGLLHLEGVGVLQDYERAFELICGAAEQNEPNAMFNCGSLYQDGKGVEKNAEKAKEWFEKGAKLNNIAAQNSLGILLTGQDAKEEELKQAFGLWQKTAAQGNPYGLFRLGDAYARGVGIEKDLVKAHAYLNLAGARGLKDATTIRSAIESEMSTQQINEAQQLARSWRPEGVEQQHSAQKDTNFDNHPPKKDK